MIPLTLYEIAGIIGAYLMGSIPTGLWLGLRLKNIDIREHGSKNIGATNTMRVLGKKLGATALICDILKGAIPVFLAAKFGTWEYTPLTCGLAAILGHVFPIFIGFKGGKAVATSTGVFLGLATYPTLIAAVVFGIVLGTTRMVSASSMSAAIALSIGVFFFPIAFPIRVITVLVAVLVIVKHRTNIQRILKGEESKI